MKLSELNEALNRRESGELDELLVFNQRETALLCQVTPQALQQWGIEPVRRRGREAFYYWPEVREELARRRAAQRG